MEPLYTVTFWKNDFAGDNLEQLTAILKGYAVKGKGYWFIDQYNYIHANLPESDYTWIMKHVANYDNIQINK
jgi:hypothetical protein